MAIYGDNKHNAEIHPAKIRRREIKEKYVKRAQKAKENKNKLLFDVVHNLLENNSYDNKDYIKQLLLEVLSKRTQKELKQILYGE